MPDFKDLSNGYATLWDKAHIRPEKLQEIKQAVATLMSH